MSKKIKINDDVIVITGKYKGKIGKIIKFVNNNYIIVDKINLVKKSVKICNNNNKNFILKESKINISNVAYFNKEINKLDKIKFLIINNKKFRILKSNNKILDN
ncbi:50S ribosomal protein L24 [endosymbiont of Pachyrhynchus infernalis]|uniref:50S ribosomal protein L24 n=1 Tax=endosymbiont of Pachyrhynchus infernalis TaxID=1971488 RepID=UPI000DC6D8E4|nr:50S ribosomal protein L24 [endosymbiont of Pachyrhynchus infernalis]BBA84843.1 50S ribosomal protein L24 [endosymbiont of Pachyrhynchus infernalis]